MGARRAIRPDRYPVIFARTVKLNPLAVLIAILLATELAGILGALLAIPVAGIIQVVLRDLWDHRRGAPKPEPTVGETQVPVDRAASPDDHARLDTTDLVTTGDEDNLTPTPVSRQPSTPRSARPTP